MLSYTENSISNKNKYLEKEGVVIKLYDTSKLQHNFSFCSLSFRASSFQERE